jgi:hypothetical protein
MKKNVMVGFALIVGLSFGAGACATSPKKTTVEKSNLVTLTATVQAIDQATRMVTLKGPKGDTVTFKGPSGNVTKIRAADPKNLDLIKVGDRVAVTYSEALAISVEKVKK